MAINIQSPVIWLTGLSGAGKSTLAQELAMRMRADGERVEILDGDVVRQVFSRDLGFTREDRCENVRRIAALAKLLSRNGVVVIVAAISPYRESRAAARRQFTHFTEVYVSCPLDVIVKRDVKDLYRRALSGELQNFSGISDVYEPPLAPEVTVCTDVESISTSVEKILDAVRSGSATQLSCGAGG